MTSNGKRYMAMVAQLPCSLCGSHPVQVHHIRDGAGAGQKNADFLTVPLCPDCHQGTHGVHGDKAMLYLAKKTELDLVASTIDSILRLKLHRGR